MKKINDDFARALENCANALSLAELSRVTGIRIELLRRFVTRKTRNVREETWDKIYPLLKPYMVGPEPAVEPPPRIGAPYRRHHELVDMVSDQKVLLDAFDILNETAKGTVLNQWIAAAGKDTPTTYTSLTAAENRLMGAYEHLPAEQRETMLLELVAAGTAEVRKRRAELF